MSTSFIDLSARGIEHAPDSLLAQSLDRKPDEAIEALHNIIRQRWSSNTSTSSYTQASWEEGEIGYADGYAIHRVSSAIQRTDGQPRRTQSEGSLYNNYTSSRGSSLDTRSERSMDSYAAANSRGANSLAQRGLRGFAQEDSEEIQKHTTPPHIIHYPLGADIDASAITEVNVRRPPKNNLHESRGSSAGKKVEAPPTTSEDSRCYQSPSGYISDQPAVVELPPSVLPTQQVCNTYHKRSLRFRRLMKGIVSKTVRFLPLKPVSDACKCVFYLVRRNETTKGAGGSERAIDTLPTPPALPEGPVSVTL